MSELKRQFELLKSKVSGPKAEEPVPFQLTCSCGETHHGLRSATWKRVDCGVCGVSLFILPRDVYPVPRQKGEHSASAFTAVTGRIASLFAGRQAAAPPAVAATVVVEEEVSDDVDTVTELGDDDAVEMFDESEERRRPATAEGGQRRRRKRPSRAEARPRPQSANRPRRKPSAAPQQRPQSVAIPDDAPEQELASLFEHAARRRSSGRLITPVRLIAVAMVLLVCATTYWMWHRNQVSSAGQKFREAYSNGQQLIADREFPKAVIELRKAEEAATLLQRDDRDAVMVSQLLREVTAVTQLAEHDLIEWLQTGIDNGDADTAELAERIVRLQSEKWFVFDVLVSPGQDSMLQIECPFIIDGRDVRIECSTDRLIQHGEAARCLFAAQISELRGVGDLREPWQVRLSTESVTPITNPDVCAELGLLEIDPQLSDVIAAQAVRLGIGDSTGTTNETTTGTGT